MHWTQVSVRWTLFVIVMREGVRLHLYAQSCIQEGNEETSSNISEICYSRAYPYQERPLFPFLACLILKLWRQSISPRSGIHQVEFVASDT